ncbi:MAG TPA: transglycosylase SLT domain-containing protein [Myxococcota bacterium]|jgi:soluble lytic murein transglycosylase-like protein
MSRRRVALLTFVSALLLVDGEHGRSASGRDPRGASDAFGAAEVAATLQRANRELAPAEVERIASAVVRYSRKYAIDPVLVTAVLLVESSARPWARSPKGAIGLMQIMPHVIVPSMVAGNLATIESNIEGGCYLLADNIRRLGEEDGISAYFWGSEIRGPAYLSRVRAAREAVLRQAES